MSRDGGARDLSAIQAGVKGKIGRLNPQQCMKSPRTGITDWWAPLKSTRPRKICSWSINGSFKDDVGHMSRSLNCSFSNPMYPHTICASVLLSLSFPGIKKGKVALGVI